LGGGDAGGVNADEDFASAGQRLGRVVVAERLWTAVGVLSDGIHDDLVMSHANEPAAMARPFLRSTLRPSIPKGRRSDQVTSIRARIAGNERWRQRASLDASAPETLV